MFSKACVVAVMMLFVLFQALHAANTNRERRQLPELPTEAFANLPGGGNIFGPLGSLGNAFDPSKLAALFANLQKNG